MLLWQPNEEVQGQSVSTNEDVLSVPQSELSPFALCSAYVSPHMACVEDVRLLILGIFQLRT